MKLLRLSIVALSLLMVVACDKRKEDPKPPTLTGFSAGSGNVNVSITITGANFDVTPAKNIVKFGDVQAEVTAATVT
ncbi:MAG: IPT/TIG domain-containing protein, partial [Raineya sp.]|nr:IPT/TIG domain-containing protein [Raineya sp.]